MSKKTLTGINIQFPISRLIVDGQKSVETRTYPIPEKLLGQELAIIETPGKTGKFKTQVIGVIKFKSSFRYKSEKEFYSDIKRHCVSKDSPWKWSSKKEKWGWIIESVRKINPPITLRKRTGVVYAKDVIVEH